VCCSTLKSFHGQTVQVCEILETEQHHSYSPIEQTTNKQTTQSIRNPTQSNPMARSRMAAGGGIGIGGPPPPPVYARGRNYLSGGVIGDDDGDEAHHARQQLTTRNDTNGALQVEVQGMSYVYYPQKVDVHDLELSAKPQFFVRVSRFNGKHIE
jgi:hypothetical protein